MTEIELPDEVEDHPPSDKYVLFALETAGRPLTYTDIANRTRVYGATLSRALDRLAEDDLINRDASSDDARSYLYTSNI